MTPSNTIADVQQDMDFYSDLYKDRHGFRPRNQIGFWMERPLTTQAEIDDLVSEIHEATMAVSSMPLNEG